MTNVTLLLIVSTMLGKDLRRYIFYYFGNFFLGLSQSETGTVANFL